MGCASGLQLGGRRPRIKQSPLSTRAIQVLEPQTRPKFPHQPTEALCRVPIIGGYPWSARFFTSRAFARNSALNAQSVGDATTNSRTRRRVVAQANQCQHTAKSKEGRAQKNALRSQTDRPTRALGRDQGVVVDLECHLWLMNVRAARAARCRHHDQILTEAAASEDAGLTSSITDGYTPKAWTDDVGFSRR